MTSPLPIPTHACPRCGYVPVAPALRPELIVTPLTELMTRLLHLETLIEELTMAVDHGQYQLDALTARFCVTDHYGLGRGGRAA